MIKDFTEIDNQMQTISDSIDSLVEEPTKELTNAEKDQLLIEEANAKYEDSEFTHEQLDKALMHVEDVFDRALVGVVVMGKLGRQMYDYELPQFYGDRIDIGILRRHLSEFARSVIFTYSNGIIVDGVEIVSPNELVNVDVFQMSKGGVPIYVNVMPDDFKYLQNPELKTYKLATFLLPNPFEDYYQEYLEFIGETNG